MYTSIQYKHDPITRTVLSILTIFLKAAMVVEFMLLNLFQSQEQTNVILHADT